MEEQGFGGERLLDDKNICCGRQCQRPIGSVSAVYCRVWMEFKFSKISSFHLFRIGECWWWREKLNFRPEFVERKRKHNDETIREGEGMEGGMGAGWWS